MMMLPGSERISMTRFTVLTQYRNVTDGQTDSRLDRQNCYDALQAETR